MPSGESEKIEEIKEGINFVEKNGYLHIQEPDESEKEKLNNAIIKRTNIYKSQRDIVEEIMDMIGIEKIYREKLHAIIRSAYKNELDRDRLYDIVRANYNLMN